MYEHAVRAIQLRLERVFRNESVSLLSIACNYHRSAFFRIVFSDQMILGVRDNYIVTQVYAQIFGPIQVPLFSVSGMRKLGRRDDGSNLAGFINNAKRIPAPLQDIDVAF